MLIRTNAVLFLLYFFIFVILRPLSRTCFPTMYLMEDWWQYSSWQNVDIATFLLVHSAVRLVTLIAIQALDAGGHHSSRLARGSTRLTRLLRSLLTDVPAPTAHAPPELISHSHSPARQLLMGDERSALALRVKPATAQLECEWLHFTSQNKPFNLALLFIPVDLSNANDSPTYHLIGSLIFINKDGNAIKYGKD